MDKRGNFHAAAALAFEPQIHHSTRRGGVFGYNRNLVMRRMEGLLIVGIRHQINDFHRLLLLLELMVLVAVLVVWMMMSCSRR
jgi:hypothetical protein